MNKINIIFFMILALSLPSFAKDSALFKLSKKIHLNGDQRWDYLTVDSATHRLFIARTDKVTVLDTKAGKPLAEISGLHGVHGVALDPDHQLGFISNGKSGTVTVFASSSLKVLSEIKVGENPDSLVYDKFSKNLFVFNGKSKDFSVIDPEQKKVIATGKLTGKPEFSVTNEAGKIFVNLEDTSQLVQIDAKSFAVEKVHALKPCEEPTGLSIDKASHLLFVGCGNKIMAVVNSENGKIETTFAVGENVDATAYDSTRNLAFASAGDGSLAVFMKVKNTFEPLQTLPTLKGSKTMAQDSVTGNVFVMEAQFAEPPAKSAPGTRPHIVPGSSVLSVFAIEK